MIETCNECKWEIYGKCECPSSVLRYEETASINKICSCYMPKEDTNPIEIVEEEVFYSELICVAEISRENQHLINDFAKALLDDYEVYVLRTDKKIKLLVKEKDNGKNEESN